MAYSCSHSLLFPQLLHSTFCGSQGEGREGKAYLSNKVKACMAALQTKEPSFIFHLSCLSIPLFFLSFILLLCSDFHCSFFHFPLTKTASKTHWKKGTAALSVWRQASTGLTGRKEQLVWISELKAESLTPACTQHTSSKLVSKLIHFLYFGIISN